RRIDAFGDPLPPGARARLGTTRLHGEAALSPDGKLLALVRNRRIVLADPRTGRVLRVLEGRFEGVPLFCYGGRLLLARGALDYPTLAAWDAQSGRPLGKVEPEQIELPDRGSLRIPEDGLSADGKRFVVQYESGADPRVLTVW